MQCNPINSFTGEFKKEEIQYPNAFAYDEVKEVSAAISDSFRKEWFIPVLTAFNGWDEHDTIVNSVNIVPVKKLLERGIAEADILMLLSKKLAELFLEFKITPQEFFERTSELNECGITLENVPIWKSKWIFQGYDYDVLKKFRFDQNDYELYEILKKNHLFPPCAETIDQFVHCTELAKGLASSILRNMPMLTEEDLSVLCNIKNNLGVVKTLNLFDKKSKFILFGIAGYTPMYQKTVEWIVVCRGRDSMAFPAYAALHSKYVKEIKECFYLSHPSYVTFVPTEMCLWINIQDTINSVICNEFNFGNLSNIKGSGDFVPVWCKNWLLERELSCNYTDFELISQIYFLIQEINDGNSDWELALKDESVNSWFPYYASGRSLAEAILEKMRVELKLNWNPIPCGELANYIEVGEHRFSPYDCMDDLKLFLVKLVKSGFPQNVRLIRRC